MSRESPEGGYTATLDQPNTQHSQGQHQSIQFDGGAGSLDGDPSTSSASETAAPSIPKWSFGILNDQTTEEVPGTVLLLSSFRNEPLGVEPKHDQRKDSSMPAQLLSPRLPSSSDKKTTKCGGIILEPQPDDSKNDPLNWSAWRRDSSLLSLGFYCMLGGGMTPILAAGFNDVAATYDVSFSQVALTTGLYMMGLGVGSVLFSPTAILYGKRPVYLFSAILFILTSVWCAMAPSYAQLATARVFQGISVSPVECLPSATIAEIFFLHERAFRVGIYTLLLLGGKNLVPLVSAVIIEAKGWRWVFWVVTIVAAFGMVLLFFFVPETFWDRTPRPKARHLTLRRSLSSIARHSLRRSKSHQHQPTSPDALEDETREKMAIPEPQNLHRDDTRPNFTDGAVDEIAGNSLSPDHGALTHPPGGSEETEAIRPGASGPEHTSHFPGSDPEGNAEAAAIDFHPPSDTDRNPDNTPAPGDDIPHLHNLNSPYYRQFEGASADLGHHQLPGNPDNQLEAHRNQLTSTNTETSTLDGHPLNSLPDVEKSKDEDRANVRPKIVRYTTNLRQAPPQPYVQTLKPWNGRLSRSRWHLVALRPFILFCYPAVLWSALVYSLSVGWLIVLSESISHIYRDRDTYNFSALQSGLVYLSPFIGGILGTAVAGKVSDIIVRFMARRNGGVYEPEFRLVMGAPIALSTAIGLIGYGWSAEERNNWIVPTVFFGVISFGCSLGSTTAITFCVDSYRQFAGEALVTLNFSKNVFHGLVFSLFFAQWLESEGPKNTFLVIGILQIACMLTTIPMYIYGKRARMWTVRKRLMDKF